MPNREALKHHAGLVDQMATKLGVDLQQSAIDGDVSLDELSEAVLRCTGCANPAHCEGYLKQSGQVDKTPEYCRNQELLGKLIP